MTFRGLLDFDRALEHLNSLIEYFKGIEDAKKLKGVAERLEEAGRELRRLAESEGSGSDRY